MARRSDTKRRFEPPSRRGLKRRALHGISCEASRSAAALRPTARPRHGGRGRFPRRAGSGAVHAGERRAGPAYRRGGRAAAGLIPAERCAREAGPATGGCNLSTRRRISHETIGRNGFSSHGSGFVCTAVDDEDLAPQRQSQKQSGRCHLDVIHSQSNPMLNTNHSKKPNPPPYLSLHLSLASLHCHAYPPVVNRPQSTVSRRRSL